RRAIEPARNAWAEVSREIATATQIQVEGTGNPWTVHPVAEGLNDDERQRFFATGELPPWKLDEMAKLESTHHNGASDGETQEIQDLDYPMPHSELPYQPAPPFAEP